MIASPKELTPWPSRTTQKSRLPRSGASGMAGEAEAGARWRGSSSAPPGPGETAGSVPAGINVVTAEE